MVIDNKVKLSKLDHIIAVIEDTWAQPWSSEAEPGLRLLQKHKVKFAKSELFPENFVAWHENSPDIQYHASNGLIAGCLCYIAAYIDNYDNDN